MINLVGNHPENKARAGAAGAVEAIIEALRTHTEHAEVQSDGWWALDSLTSTNSNNLNAVSKAGGKEMAQAALKTHADTDNLVHRAQRVLDRM